MCQALSHFPKTTNRQRCGGSLALAILLVLSLGVDMAKGQDLAQIGKGKPFRMNGSLSLLGGPYFYSGDGTPRNQPFWWSANGSVTLSIYDWQVPFSFTFSSQERSYAQPFNRYGLSPHYKWVKLHIGYRSMQFNPYVLSGLQFLGGGVELDPKGFRFAAFYGRFNKAVSGDTSATTFTRPAYERWGYGVKIGAGSRRSHVDVMFLRAMDDVTSIPDPGAKSGITPKENLVLGLSGRVAIGPRITFQFDGAGSALTENTLLPPTSTEGIPHLSSSFFTPRFGSMLLFAGNASVGYLYHSFGLRMVVKQVDPGYASLGSFYQQSDVRSITIDPSFRLFKNKLRYSGSLGKQRDNTHGQKTTTSLRTIVSSTISVEASKHYGADVSFTNFGITQQAGLSALSDTFRVAQVNRSITLTQRWNTNNQQRSLTITLTGGYQAMRDLNDYGTFASVENQVLFGNLFFSRVRIRNSLSVNGGVNFNSISTDAGENLLVGPSVGFARNMVKDKLVMSMTATWNQGIQNGKGSGTAVNGGLQLRYRVSPTHQFQFTVNALQNNTPFAGGSAFTEVRVLGGYTLTLRTKEKKP